MEGLWSRICFSSLVINGEEFVCSVLRKDWSKPRTPCGVLVIRANQ